jgi:excisionase family DNA binding protein
MKEYSTSEVAQKVGVHYITLLRYISEKKVPAPTVRRAGGVQFRIWREADIKKLLKILPKIANGRKTRYQKGRAKKKGSKRTSKKK